MKKVCEYNIICGLVVHPIFVKTISGYGIECVGKQGSGELGITKMRPTDSRFEDHNLENQPVANTGNMEGRKLNRLDSFE